MQTPEIILGAIVLVPIVLLMVLRINAALVFLSLCLGDVLVQFVASDANSFTSLFSASPKVQSVANNGSAIQLGLLLLPVLLTALFMIKTVKGAKLAFNVLPAAGVGFLGALLAVPLLSAGTSANITGSSLWVQVTRAQDLIVGTSALVCLLMIWMMRPKHSKGEEKHNKKH
jgi:hypothetical protein